jgi:hypothetical protein
MVRLNLVKAKPMAYALRIFCALFLRLIFFFRHFQRCCPRFFQTLELLFMYFPRRGG